MLVRTVLGVLLALSLSRASQDTTALFGHVSRDAFPVAGAIVTLSNRGFVKSATTDASGRFVLEAVPPGRYDFRTSAHGYAVFECSIIVHSHARRNWIDVKGLLPADQQTVSVSDLAARKLARN
jgi:hypothetical protein